MNIRNLIKLSLFASTVSLVTDTSLAGASFWKNQPFLDVTDDLEDCHAPTYGRPEVNYKKICTLRGEKYYLKAATDESAKEAFARQFATNNLKVLAPITEWLYEEEGEITGIFGMPVKIERYIASKSIQDYVSVYDKSPSLFRLFCPVPQCHFTNVCRAMLADTIGERGIAQLAVALTFYGDMNMSNWGFSGNQLVLIDVDHMPTTFPEFISTAIHNIHKYLLWLVGALTLENLTEMKNIYQEMANRPLPITYGDEGISNELYQSLIQAYSEACQYAIDCVLSDTCLEAPSLSYDKGMYALIDGFNYIKEKYDLSYSRQLIKLIV